jgi:EamA domain-containing membrane protein RarD
MLIVVFVGGMRLLASLTAARKNGTTHLQIAGFIVTVVALAPLLWVVCYAYRHLLDPIGPRGVIPERIVPAAFFGGLAVFVLGVSMAYFGRLKRE